jgi:predicted metal-binding membrane protein
MHVWQCPHPIELVEGTMAATTQSNASELARPAATPGIGGWLARPQDIAIVCIFLISGLGWLTLGLMVSGMGADGPAWLAALCQPLFGSAASVSAWPVVDFLLVLGMWSAMALAMMLPTAAPMILTYAQIAETAAAKGETVVSPPVIAAGFLVVWLGFALIASLLHVALTRASLLDATFGSVNTLFAGGILLAAGLYQFSALKQACLAKCQHPFPFFFANWSDTRKGVFGVMNIVWMAVLGVIMALEKLSTTPRLSRAVGIVLGLAGLAFIISAMITHWPVRSV